MVGLIIIICFDTTNMNPVLIRKLGIKYQGFYIKIIYIIGITQYHLRNEDQIDHPVAGIPVFRV